MRTAPFRSHHIVAIYMLLKTDPPLPSPTVRFRIRPISQTLVLELSDKKDPWRDLVSTSHLSRGYVSLDFLWTAVLYYHVTM